MELGWTNVPKNQTDIKTKIVDRLLAMRILSDTSKNMSWIRTKYLICCRTCGGIQRKVKLFISTIDCACLD